MLRQWFPHVTLPTLTLSVGGATALALSGVSSFVIQKLGRWKSIRTYSILTSRILLYTTRSSGSRLGTIPVVPNLLRSSFPQSSLFAFLSGLLLFLSFCFFAPLPFPFFFPFFFVRGSPLPLLPLHPLLPLVLAF